MNIRWTIGRKLWLQAGAAAVLLIVLAVTALNVINGLNEAVANATRLSHAVRSHMAGDMMHDALRGDVLAAFLSATRHRDAKAEAMGAAAPASVETEQTDLMPSAPRVPDRAPERDDIEADLAEHAASFREELAANKARLVNPELLSAVNSVGPALDEYIGGAEALVSLAFTDLDAAQAQMGDFMDLFGVLEERMEDVSDRLTEAASTDEAQVQEDITRALWTMSLILVAALAILGWLATVITRGIVGPINRAAAIAGEIAGGNLDQRIEINASDETAVMLHALQDMCDRVGAIMAEVRTAAETVSGSSQEVASGSLDLSQRIEETAATLEQTTSTMKEIAETVAGNADLAGKAGGIAGEASKRTSASMDVVGRTSGAMDEAERASGRIEEIISTIDGIAFQTNLLALNAAVEAARAGEQGRGFAVVAQEVRTLAQRCAEAAGEVKTLVADNVDKVRQGSSLAQESGNRLKDTADAINQLTGMVRDVASASGDQANAIDQVNRAVTQMDSVTQQNAALVEELASASSTMDAKARELIQAVNFFKLSQSAGGGRSAGARRRAPEARMLPSA